jgi:hypothetical protein
MRRLVSNFRIALILELKPDRLLDKHFNAIQDTGPVSIQGRRWHIFSYGEQPMAGIELSIPTNMATPFQVPFFREFATGKQLKLASILVYVQSEANRQQQMENDDTSQVKVLLGITVKPGRLGYGQSIFDPYWTFL